MKARNTYQKRRDRLGELFPETLFVIPSGTQPMRSHSVGYRFKTSSDFYYLTGLHHTGATLIVLGGTQILLLDRREVSVFEDQGAADEHEVRRLDGLPAQDSARLEATIRDLIPVCGRIAITTGRDPGLESLVFSFTGYNRSRRGARAGSPLMIGDAKPFTGRLRAVKDQGEIALMREAAHRSSVVHTQIMGGDFRDRTELQVSNLIEAGFLAADMQWPAYETIVGSGPRSTLLHARGSQRRPQDGEVILIDAGGEWEGYCSDITRVIPAGQKFSREQKKIYETVLKAQKLVLQAVAPGRTLQQLQELAQESMRDSLGLADLSHLMPHSTSHWIGLDVHDPCPYVDESGSPVKLTEGMTFTVEPALYFKDKGIGVRIEDDVLVTANGCEVLTLVPKEVDEVEELRRGSVSGGL